MFVDSSEKDLIKNSFGEILNGEILNKDNIDTFIPELTKENASTLLKNIQQTSVLVSNGEVTWESYFNVLRDKGNGAVVDLIKNTKDLSKLTGDDLVKANQQARASTLAHNKMLKQQTLAAKGASIALKGLALVGNMFVSWAVMWAVGEAIQFITETIDEAIVTAEEYFEQQQEIISKAEETISSTEARIKSLESLQEQIKETNGSQAELLELSSEINSVLGDGASKILNQANAYAVLNAQLEHQIELEKEEQKEAKNEKKDAHFELAKNTTVTDTRYKDQEVTFGQILSDEIDAEIKIHTDKNGHATQSPEIIQKTIQQIFNEKMSDYSSGGMLTADDVVDTLYSIMQDGVKSNTGKYNVSKEELKEGLKVGLENLYSYYDDIISNGEGFLQSGDKKNIIEQLYYRASGDVDDVWKENVANMLKALDSETVTINNAFSDYYSALNDNIEYNESEALLKVGSLFDNLKLKFPKISDILDDYFKSMIGSLQGNIITSEQAIGKFAPMVSQGINSATNAIQYAAQKAEDQGKLDFFNTLSEEEKELVINAYIPDSVVEGTTEDFIEFVEELTGKAVVPISLLFTTEEQKEAIDNYQSKVSSLGKTLASLRSGETISMTDLLQEFPELVDKTDNLDQAIQDLIYQSLNELYELLGEGAPEALKDDLERIANEATGLIPALSEAFPLIQNSFKVLKEFEDAMNSDSITGDILSDVSSLSANLQVLVAGFHAGTVSIDEIYEALLEHYKTDEKNYGNALIAKNAMNEEFYASVGMLSADVINHFNDNYRIDLKNCETYNKAKIEIENQTMQKIAENWSHLYDVQTQSFTGLGAYLQSQADQIKDVKTKANFINNSGLGQIYILLGQMEQAKKDLNNIVYDGINDNFESSYGKYYSDSSSSATDSYLDDIHSLIELRIEMIKDMKQKEIEAIEKIIEAEKEKLEAIQNTIDARKEAIELLKDEREHEEELAEKNKSVSDIQNEIDSLAMNNSASAQKKRRELQEELVEAQKELNDYIREYEYEQAIKALDEEAEAAEKAYEEEEARLQGEID